MDLELNDRVAIVTGASQGIGAAVAIALHKEGMRVCVVARNKPNLEAVRKTIADDGGDCHVIAADLTDPEAAEHVCAEAARHYGGIDVLVNNAGDTKAGSVLSVSDEDWHRNFELKFFGYARMIKAAWPHLKARGGRLINVIGINANAGMANAATGGAVNSAVVSLTKSTADLGVRDGVGVNAISPGRIATDRQTTNLERIVREKGVPLEQATAELLKESGTNRFGQPEEIGYLAAFLCSPKADYLQGAIIDIDGGQTKSL